MSSQRELATSTPFLREFSDGWELEKTSQEQSTLCRNLSAFLTIGIAILMISARDSTGDERSLIYGASQGDVERVKELIDKGVNVNARNDAGWTALMWAAEAGSSEVTKLLLERGARVDIENKKGWAALKLAGKNGSKEIEALLRAAGARK